MRRSKKRKREAEENADADLKRKSLIETKNEADGLAHQVEKQLEEMGDKLPAEDKSKIEESIGRSA